ncbi:MAG: hypothetical protein ACRCYE_08655, partial [Sarcina sp.]
MKYYYEVYGLNLESEFKIDTLTLKKTLDIDIKIQNTCILDSEKNLIKKDLWFYKNVDIFLFYIETVGYYRVTKDFIQIDLNKNYQIKDFEVYLLGTALGMAMYFKNIIAIHGGIVEIKRNDGIIICGEMGAGKSSLIDSFINSGYKFLADDVARASKKEGRFIVSSAYPQRRLCKDYIKNNNYDISNLEFRNEDREKYALNDFDSYLDSKIYLDAIIELKIG